MQFYNFEDINRGPSWIAKAIPVNVKTHQHCLCLLWKM